MDSNTTTCCLMLSDYQQLGESFPLCQPHLFQHHSCFMENDHYIIQRTNVDEPDVIPFAMERNSYSTDIDMIRSDCLMNIFKVEHGHHEVKSLRFCAEAAIMNPNLEILAVRGANCVLFYHLETNYLLKRAYFPHAVEYISWISPFVLAIITQRQAFHWEIVESQELSVHIFDRFQSLRNAIIIGYQTSPDFKWCLLCSVLNNALDGAMQMYSVDNKASQVITGHAGCFSYVRFPNRVEDSLVVVLVEQGRRDQSSIDSQSFSSSVIGSRLLCVELGASRQSSNRRADKQAIPLELDPAIYSSRGLNCDTDFAVRVLIPCQQAFEESEQSRYGYAYIVTKLGVIVLVDIVNGIVLSALNVFDLDIPRGIGPRLRSSIRGVIFAACELRTSHREGSGDRSMCGIRVLSTRGELFDVVVDCDTLLGLCCLRQLKSFDLALLVCRSLTTDSHLRHILLEFHSSLQGGRIQYAAQLAKLAKNQFLRCQAVLYFIDQLPSVFPDKIPLQLYVNSIIESPFSIQFLNEEESSALVALVCRYIDSLESSCSVPMSTKGWIEWLTHLVFGCHLTLTPEQGAKLELIAPELSHYIIQRTNHENIAGCLFHEMNIPGLISYAAEIHWDVVRVVDIIEKMIHIDPAQGLQLAVAMLDQCDAVDNAGKDYSGFDAARQPRSRSMCLLVCAVSEVFLSANLLGEGSTFLLRALHDRDCQEDALLQTRLLECNLLGDRSEFAQEIIESRRFSYYNRGDIAALCEYAGLFSTAAVLYPNEIDINRCILAVSMSAASSDPSEGNSRVGIDIVHDSSERHHASASAPPWRENYSSESSSFDRPVGFDLGTANDSSTLFDWPAVSSTGTDPFGSMPAIPNFPYVTASGGSAGFDWAPANDSSALFDWPAVPSTGTDPFDSMSAVTEDPFATAAVGNSAIIPPLTAELRKDSANKRRISIRKVSNLPEAFYCPISMELMLDPVVCEDGHSYERRYITSWFEKSNRSPITNLVLNSTAVIPNHALRTAIAALSLKFE